MMDKSNTDNLERKSAIILKSAKNTTIILRFHIYPTTPLGQEMTQGQFQADFNRFEFRVLLLLD